jgi:hypothetical protein
MGERLRRVLRRVGRYFAARFSDVTRSEAAGYAVWVAFGVVVGVPEIWAAAAGDNFLWPTISSTVGHLEDKWAIVAIAPVALLAASAYTLAKYEPGLVLQAGDQALRRTEEGRLVRLGEVTPAAQHELALSPNAPLPDRSKIPLVPYFAIATAVVVAGSLLAAIHHNPWLLGYVLYSLIAVFWMLIPNWLAYRRRIDVPFTTLFVTLRTLRRRLQFVALVLLAGLATLLIHLAIYPWPDLARESASYAGRNPGQAREKATEELKTRGLTKQLEFSAQSKGISKGKTAWFVYFLSADEKLRCLVLVDEKTADIQEPCPTMNS